MQSEIFSFIDSSQFPLTEDGPLTSKGIALQPNMSVRGWSTEAGTVALEGYVAVEDATVVRRLKEAGALISGSTRMSELGFGLNGDTSVRTLDENNIDVVLVMDTMGEARIAAAAGGVFGFKPSYGIVSRFGLIGLVPSMECYGILSKSLQDVASVMGVIAGNDDRDFSMPEFELPDFSQALGTHESIDSVGVIKECFDILDSNDSIIFRDTLTKLEKAGVKIHELSFSDFDLFRKVHNVIGSVEASSSCGKYDGVRYGHRTTFSSNWNEMYLQSRAESFGLLIKTYLLQGAYFQFENYSAFENACRIRSRLFKQTEELFRGVDILALPTRCFHDCKDPAITINEVYDSFLLTLFANVTGQPSVTVPDIITKNSTDLGLQLVGPHLSDARLISLAAQLQEQVKGDK